MKPDLKALARPWMGPLLALVILYVVFGSMTDGNFLRGVTQVTIARQTVVVALGAIGMTLVIVSGGIDLSIGSVVALAAVVVAKALDAGYGPITAAVLGAGVGLLCGALNGALVAALRITPFIVTLGTMSALRGLAKGRRTSRRSTPIRAGSKSSWRCSPAAAASCSLRACGSRSSSRSPSR